MKRLSPRQVFYGSVIRAVITLIVLVALWAIMDYLPMLKNLKVEAVAMSGVDIAKVAISLIIVGVLLRFAHVLEPQLPIIVPRFPQSGTLAASIVQIIAIFIAYSALLPLAEKLLKGGQPWNTWDYTWIFQVVFLLSLCYPLYRGGRAFYKGIDEIAGFFTADNGTTSDESVKCPKCGAESETPAKFCAQCGTEFTPPAVPKTIVCQKCRVENEASARFCAQCGTNLTPPAEPKVITCPQCGAEIKPEARYCTRCGTELSRGD